MNGLGCGTPARNYLPTALAHQAGSPSYVRVKERNPEAQADLLSIIGHSAGGCNIRGSGMDAVEMFAITSRDSRLG